jgi:toxin ParE1/3/4
MGRIGRVPDTHEWVVRGLPYIIVYEVGVTVPDEVVILAVFHPAQNREDE